MKRATAAALSPNEATSTSSAGLARVLLRHHPEAFDHPSEALSRRVERRVEIARVDESFEVELTSRALAKTCATASGGGLEAFLAGEGPLSNIGAVGCPLELQDVFGEEVLGLRAGLIARFGSDVDAVMLADTAASAFFEARHLSLLARTVLRAGLDADQIKRAEQLEQMASRAHRRALASLELLRRPQGAALDISYEEPTKVSRPPRKAKGRTT